jgi:hypothetical protein
MADDKPWDAPGHVASLQGTVSHENTSGRSRNTVVESFANFCKLFRDDWRRTAANGYMRA